MERIKPFLHGWDDEKVYFCDEQGHDHCVSDQPELIEQLQIICQDFYRKHPPAEAS